MVFEIKFDFFFLLNVLPKTFRINFIFYKYIKNFVFSKLMEKRAIETGCVNSASKLRNKPVC